MSNTIEELMKGLYPYADEYGVIREFPEKGRSPSSILDELRSIARGEDAAWENGRCSGTMYSGLKPFSTSTPVRAQAFFLYFAGISAALPGRSRT